MTHSFVHSIGQYVQSWFSQEKIVETDDALVELPDIIQSQLMQQIQALPNPQAYQATVQEEILAAIKTWQHNLDAPNSLVFLGSPVEPIADILSRSLNNWQDPPLQVITPLPCLIYPSEPLMMTHQIQQSLKPYINLV